MTLKYATVLKKQYMAANGLSSFNYIKEENSEFIEWIKQQQKIKEIYQNYLLASGVYYDDPDNVEIGKGKYDTITSKNGHSLLITPFYDSFEKSEILKRAVPGILETGKGYQRAIIGDQDNIKASRLFLDDFKLFYTHNPYSTKDLYNLGQLHNNGKEVVIGAYGKIYDKDRIAKIKQLKAVKEKLMGSNCKEFYVFSKDNYIYFIHTDKKENNYKERKDYSLIKER